QALARLLGSPIARVRLAWGKPISTGFISRQSNRDAVFPQCEVSPCGPLPSSVYITTCPQLAKAAVRAADEGGGFDPGRGSATIWPSPPRARRSARRLAGKRCRDLTDTRKEAL